MAESEIYCDHNVYVDLKDNRNGLSLSLLADLKASGCIFPYSPFHLEEVAVILSNNQARQTQIHHINRHLEAIKEISDLWEYIPGGGQAIQLIQEEPLASLKARVLKNHWVTFECTGLEEFIDATRSQKHFDGYLQSIGSTSKGHIRSRETIRKEHGINQMGLSGLPPSEVLREVRVQNIISQKAANYGLDSSKFPRGKALRENHDLTRKTVDCLMRVLNEIGFCADKPGKHRSNMFDVGHTIYATRASTFIVRDSRLMNRAAAIFSYLDAQTRIVKPDEFFSPTNLASLI